MLAEYVNRNESESCILDIWFEISSRSLKIFDPKKDCLIRTIDCTIELELAGLLMNIS